MISNYAPIILFCYNRPEHLGITLNALSKNTFAEQSEIFIFCDGEKKNAEKNELLKIQKVRNIVKKQKWALKTTIIENQENQGLAKSIIYGVTYVLNKFDRVIVLEDDIVPEKGFLKYMNQALEMYENDSKVGCIHAWNYPMNTFNKKQTTFFLKGADCWGWATWKRAWNHFNPNGTILYEEIIKRNLQFNFNRNGTIDFTGMLMDQINNKNDSWAIRWHASLFIKDMYCLHPVKPIVTNFGLDGSGIHCGNLEINQNTTTEIKLEKLKVTESEEFFLHFKYRKWSIFLGKLRNIFSRII
jgi:hypothetical protein